MFETRPVPGVVAPARPGSGFLRGVDAINTIVAELEAAAPAANPGKAAAKGVDDAVEEGAAKAAVAQTIRVHVDMLDTLMFRS